VKGPGYGGNNKTRRRSALSTESKKQLSVKPRLEEDMKANKGSYVLIRVGAEWRRKIQPRGKIVRSDISIAQQQKKQRRRKERGGK